MKIPPKNSVLVLLLAGTLLGAQVGFAQMPIQPDATLGGTVSAVTANRATIKTPANESFTILFEPKTVFYKQIGDSFSMDPATASDVHVGGSINVLGHLDPDGITKHASNVMILTAEALHKILIARSGRGITDVTGKVTAIRGNRLTLEDYDKSSQVIEVDDQTKIFKGYGYPVVHQVQSPAGTIPPAGIQVIKLSNIKLGDSLYAKGAPKFPITVAPKDNIFLSKRMAVMQSGPDASAPGTTPKQ